MERPQGAVPSPRVQGRWRGIQVVKPQQHSLVDWTRQKWRTYSGKPSLKTGERYLPEKAWASLSPSERAATNAAKRKAMRSGKQFSKQPAKVAAKTRAYR